MFFKVLCGMLLLGVGMMAMAAPAQIPALNWTERSDWVNVKKLGAVGNGVADDTAVIQQAFDGLKAGMTLYFPAGTYRVTSTVKLQPKVRLIGVLILGHGRDTTLVWDGPEGQPLWLDHGNAHGRYIGLSFDGRGKATVGLHHQNGPGGFETEVGHRHMAFRNFTDTGLLASGSPATAEIMIENCLFEDCGRGIAFMNFNDYDWTIDGCEFRRCGTAIQCSHGNTYIRNCRFEQSKNVDITLNPEHGSSVRRCVSVGSKAFISYGNPVAPLSVQDCQVSGWTNPDWAISIGGAPVTIFDCAFTNPPGKTPPVQIRSGGQRLFVSRNVSTATDGVYTPNVGKVYEIPAGKRKGSLTSADHRFLREAAAVPTKVFDAKVDFGAKADGRTDDTEALQKTIDAARAHGKGAIAYLPTGVYAVTKPLRVTGADYYIGGSGFKTGLTWKGAEAGAIIEVVDPQRVVMENLAVGGHDVGLGMKNECDILQTGTAKSSEITYDDVVVYGMYQRDPFRKGLCLRNLGKGAVVRVSHVQGNIRLRDAARATILLGNSYEGSVVVEGKAKERDGFLGIITRLGTSCTHALYVKDNHSLVASDFYIEQADNGYSLEGSPDDPPGRLTLQAPKMQMSARKDGQPNVAFDIRGYHGQIAYGPAQFYIDPKVMPLLHAGAKPLEMIVWGGSFYNTKLSVQKDAAARISLVGCSGVSEQLDGVQVEETLTPDTLKKLAIALDDLRLLGEMDLRINHAGMKQ
ncbi:MAG: Pectate lyase superfamily protein [bacterium ADurb.Bin429]|nr:MAG: Pectate lyase superfamily protein [bacterium ADurb.Bin429]